MKTPLDDRTRAVRNAHSLALDVHGKLHSVESWLNPPSDALDGRDPEQMMFRLLGEAEHKAVTMLADIRAAIKLTKGQ